VGIAERKEKQKEEIRKMILDASMKLFVEEGFEKVSIRKIADIIEYSPTTIYLYFKDKNEILFYLNQAGFIKLLELNASLMAIENPLLRLHKMGENYIRFGLEYPEYYDLMFIQPAPMEKLAELNLGEWKNADLTREMLKAMVAECMAKGIIKNHDVTIVAMAFWGLVHGLVSLSIRRRFEKMVDPEEVIKTMHGSLNWMMSLFEENIESKTLEIK
jgi:AcrR family transcriptional regulator